jgi:hypothetical protein
VKPLLDERGYVFSVVNVIDLLVVLLGVAVSTAGVALVSDSVIVSVAPLVLGGLVLGVLVKTGPRESGERTAEESKITLQVSEVEPFVADAIAPGDVSAEGDVTVEAVHQRPASVVEDRGERLVEREHPRLRTAVLTVRVSSASLEEGEFRGERLYVGRTFSLNLDSVRVEATVVALDAQEEVREPAEPPKQIQ